MAEATLVSAKDTILPNKKRDMDKELSRPAVLSVAQRMCEAYLDKPMPAKRVIATYTIEQSDDPLPAVADYPILAVFTVHNSNRDLLTGYTNNDALIVPTAGWIGAPLSVVYLSGMPVQVYDAIVRQAKMLDSRLDISPELEDPGFEGLTPKFNAAMRSGLSPDVKQMLHPFKVIGV